MLIFPDTLQNKFYSTLVAHNLMFVINFFICAQQYLNFCNIFTSYQVYVHICFYRKKLKPDFAFVSTIGFNSKFFILFQPSPSVCWS